MMIIEAMKMEYLIRAPYDGIVKDVFFKQNDQVEIGKSTIEIDKEE
jgi:3-methylcrotonyl-CoA carboxylase alpha subunit